MTTVTRVQALRYRWRVQGLDRPAAATPALDVPVLDLGVQDTGPDGALWALAVRGAEVHAGEWPDGLALAWTLRGAPHAYRRADLGDVSAAVRPWSDADAAKRVFDAARPLRAAGVAVLDALDRTAATMADVVREPMVKGAVSTAMTARMPEPYLRWCRPCGTTHMYEQTFRLAALNAGLELEPGTSPPVLTPGRGWAPAPPGAEPRPELDLVRATLHLLGPTTPALVAAFLDSPVADVRRRWPDDVVAVDVEGEERALLRADLDALRAAATATARTVRLLGPYDLHLQARDRDLLVPDAARRKALWPALGRPGAVVADGEVVGTWRPRSRGRRLALELDPWVPWDDDLAHAVSVEHERLAAFRGVTAA